MGCKFVSPLAYRLYSILCIILFFSASRLEAQIVTTIAGQWDSTGHVDGVAISQALFNNPHSIANDTQGNVFIVDRWGNLIRKLDTNTGMVTTIAGTGAAGDVDGPALSAQFNEPWGIACDSLGTVLYIADKKNNKLRKVDLLTNMVSTVAGDGNPGIINGPVSVARFNNPTGVALAVDGTLFVTDHLAHTIRKITPAGIVSTYAGTAFVNGDADGVGTAAQFYRPYMIELDYEGNLLVADAWNRKVRKIAPDQTVTTVAGSGIQGYLDGPAASAQFDEVWDISVGRDGTIYVMDGWNYVMRTIKDGQVALYAGQPTLSGSKDGVGNDALFDGATGITFDYHNDIFYVADAYNNQIRKVQPIPEQRVWVLADGDTISNGDTICNGARLSYIAEEKDLLITHTFVQNGLIIQTGSDTIHSYTTVSSEDYAIVIDSRGIFDIQISSDTIKFEVVDPAIAEGEITNQQFVASGLEVSFASIPPVETNVLWDFGDGNTSTQADPTHTYTSEGTFSPRLVVSNGGPCRDTLLLPTIRNYTLAISEATHASGDTICQGENLDFLASQPLFDTFIFWVNDSAYDNASNTAFNHVFDQVGVYEIYAQGFLDSLVVHSDTFSIEVIASPNIGIDYTVLGANQTNLQLNFNATGDPVSSYSWNFGDGNLGSGNSLSHTYNNPGTYLVELTGSTGGICADVEQTTIKYYPPALTEQNYSSGDTLCSGTTFQFQVSPDSADSYQWYQNGSLIFTGTSPAFSYTVIPTGQHTFHVRSITGSIEVESNQWEVWVMDTVNIAANYIFMDHSPTGLELQFDPGDTTVLSYAWDLGDGNNATVHSPGHIYASEGTYTATLIASNGGTCRDTSSVSFNYFIPVLSSPNYASGDTVCQGTVLDLEVSPNSADNYVWYLNGIIIDTTTSPLFTDTLDQLGLQTYELESLSGGIVIGSNTWEIMVVESLPTGFTYTVTGQSPAGLEVAFDPQSTIANSYQWTFGDPASGANNTSTLAQPSHTYANYGSYDVSLTLSHGGHCQATLMDSVVYRPLSIMIPPFSNLDTVCSGAALEVIAFPDTFDVYTMLVNGDTISQNTSGNFNYAVGNDPSYRFKIIAISQGNPEFSPEMQLFTVPAPTANFTYSHIDETSAGTTLQFDATMNPNANYTWIFDDPGSGANNTAAGTSTLHTFQDTGFYDVQLIVATGSWCVDTVTLPAEAKRVFVDVGPVQAGDTLCLGTSMAIDAYPAGFDEYLFYLNDSLWYQNPSSMWAYVAEDLGTHHVKVLALDNGDTIRSLDFDFVVVENPQSTATYSVLSKDEQNGMLVQFDIQPPFADQYFWNFADGSTLMHVPSDSTTIKHTFSQPGKYTVLLVADNGGPCLDSTFIEISYLDLQLYIEAYSNGDTLCTGAGPVIFEAEPAGYSDYAFYVNDSLMQSGPSETFAFTADVPGNATISVIAFDGVDSVTTNSKSLFLVEQSQANISYDLIEVNEDGYLIAFEALPPAADSYLWHLGDWNGNNASTEQNPTRLYTYLGFISTSLITMNQGMCPDTAFLTDYIEVQEVFVRSSQIDSDTLCTGDQITLSMFPDDLVAYSWFVNGQITQSTGSSLDITFDSTGVYTIHVEGLDAQGHSLTPASFTYWVMEQPDAEFSYEILDVSSAGLLVQFHSESDATAYSWEFEEPGVLWPATSTATSPQHTFTNGGQMSIRLTTSNGGACDNSNYQQNLFEFDLSDGDVFVPSAFSPNNDGVNDEFLVKVRNVESMTLSIFNRWGTKLYESSDPDARWDGRYQGRLMPTGSYVYHVRYTLRTGYQDMQMGTLTLVK